jgi:hypothetical protein
MSALQRKVVSLESEVEKLKKKVQTLSSALDNNAQVLKIVSVAVNLISEKVGITNEQVQIALAEELEKAVAGKSAENGSETLDPNSGNQRPEVLSAESNRINQISTSISQHGKTDTRESEASDHAFAIGETYCDARVISGTGQRPKHKAEDFEYHASTRSYQCKHCGILMTTSAYSDEYNVQTQHHQSQEGTRADSTGPDNRVPENP